MSMKPVAIAVAGFVLILQWPMLNHQRADAKLGEFYSQVASARFGDARKSIDEAIRLWPSNARYYAWRAYCTGQQLPSQCPRHSPSGNSALSASDRQAAQEAAADYRHSLDLNSRDAVVHHDLAWLEHLLGDDAAAAKDWKESTEIDPDNAVFHLSYGMFLEESADAHAAKEQYEAAIELTPSILDSPFFRRYRNRFTVAADSVVRDCIARIESRLAQGNDPILEARLGKLYLNSGDLARAAELLEDAARKLPNLPLVWFNLGELRQMQGDAMNAIGAYKKASVIDGSLAGPYLRIGQMDLRAGRKNAAAHNLEVAARLWGHVTPITASHNNRLYVGRRQRIDDLLPTTLVWFVSPCEASEAWHALSQLFPEKSDYVKRAQTCEELPDPHAGLE